MHRFLTLRILLFIAFFCTSSFWARAQKKENEEYEYILTEYTEDDGLPNDYLFDLAHAPDGSIWMSTKGGVVRLKDGVFQRIKEIDDKFNYNNLEIDSEGKIWLARYFTEKGRNDQVIIYDPATKITENFHESYNLSTVGIKTEYAWALYKNDGLIHLRRERAPIRDFKVDQDKLIEISPLGRPYSHIHMSNFSSKTVGLVRPTEDSVYLLINGERSNLRYELESYAKNEYMMKLFQDNEFLQEGHSGYLQKISVYDDLLIFQELRYVQVISNDLTKHTDLTEFFPNHFATRSVHSIIYDNGIFWIATDFGLIKILKRKAIFIPALKDIGISCRGISLVSDNEVLITTERGVFVYDKITKKEVRILKASAYSSYRIGNDKYLVPSGRKIAYEITRRNGEWEQSKKVIDPINNSTTLSMIKDQNGVVWAGTTHGLAKYDTITKLVDNFEFGNTVFTDFCYNRDSSILLAQSDNGLLEISMSSGDKAFNPLFENIVVSAVHFDLFDENITWIATRYRGLIKWNTKTNAVTYITKEDGLSHDNVHSVFQDSLNRLWMSTDFGISILHARTNRINFLLPEDGFHEREMNRNSYMFEKDGELWYGTINGLFHFNVYDFDFSNISSIDEFAILYTSAVDGKEKYRSFEPVKGQAIRIGKNFIKPVLSLNHNSSKASFSTFRYRLTVVDEWNYTQNSKIDLTSLKEGESSMIIQEKIGVSKWDLPEVLSFDKFTPLYRRNYFYLICGLLGVSSLLIYLLYINRKRKRLNEKIQRKVEESTVEIATQNQQLKASKKVNDTLFSIISHDLRSPLMGLTDLSKSMSYLKKENDFPTILKLSKSVDDYATNLLTTVNRLLEWSIVQRSDVKLYKEFKVGNSILEVVDELKSVASQKRISIEIANKGNVEITADPGSFKVLVYNLLNNAIKFSHQDSAIDIEVVDSPLRKVSIQDYGVGIKEDIFNSPDDSSIFKTTRGTDNESGFGLGLKICLEICSQMNWQLKIRNNVNGTLVEILFD